ncbi:MAG: TonB-dependent receptor [Corticimicrobacter sp.]|uniref:TonB-dependent receptor n=1 Tax=Corticimicrobacter sp. TaxID=2678536 RepID=UPI0032DB65B3
MKHIFPGAGALCATLLILASPAVAQSAADTPVSVSLPAQPLAQALNAFARQTGLELIVRPDSVAGRTAPAVQGSLTPAQALERLLAGTGLGFRIEEGAIVISRTEDSASALHHGGELSAITVQASADASAGGLLDEYAGGQVARGGRVGVLGARDNMDTPFSLTSYTNRLIRDQQARSVADVLQNDPSVRTARGFGNFQETYFIRGFLTTSDDIAYNGLYGLLPRQFTSAEMIERVEVMRGAGAFLYGAAPSGMGIGGTVNILPKRAASEPLNSVTLGTASGGQAYVAADFSRRFGEDQRSGLRVNVARRDGDTAIDGEHVELDLVTLGWDWRGERLRLSADAGYQNNRLSGMRPNVSLSGVDSVPVAPDARHNYAQPWTRSNEEDFFGTLRAEYDFNDAVTGWAAIGARRGKEFNSLAGVTVSNAETGEASAYRFDNRRRDDVWTGEVGVRAALQTGSVRHDLVASVSHYDHEERNAIVMDFMNTLATNIYDPTYWDRPAFSANAFRGGDLGDPGLFNHTRLTSFTLGDTMSLFDDRLDLIVGLRHQRLRSTAYNYARSLPEDNPYDDSHNSPVAGIVYKLDDSVSVYANYIESLAQGESAPSNGTAINAGERLPPYVSKQKEIGLKYDGGQIGGSLALFTTEQPRGYVGTDRVFREAGKNRHRGAELMLYGEAWPGLRLLGGITLLDAKQRNTGNPAHDGKRVIGVPSRQANLGVEWDVPGTDGLALNARVIATGSRYADVANTLRAPGWVRLDLGASYMMDIGDRLLTLRARLENATGLDYWSSVGGYPNNGYLVLGAPRTFMLNATLEF